MLGERWIRRRTAILEQEFVVGPFGDAEGGCSRLIIPASDAEKERLVVS
jgi:hypothetical protein